MKKKVFIYVFLLNHATLFCQKVEFVENNLPDILQPKENLFIKISVDFNGPDSKNVARAVSVDIKRTGKQNFDVWCEVSDFFHCSKLKGEQCYCEEEIGNQHYIIVVNKSVDIGDSHAELKVMLNDMNKVHQSITLNNLPKVVNETDEKKIHKGQGKACHPVDWNYILISLLFVAFFGLILAVWSTFLRIISKLKKKVSVLEKENKNNVAGASSKSQEPTVEEHHPEWDNMYDLKVVKVRESKSLISAQQDLIC